MTIWSERRTIERLQAAVQYPPGVPYTTDPNIFDGRDTEDVIKSHVDDFDADRGDEIVAEEVMEDDEIESSPAFSTRLSRRLKRMSRMTNP